MNSTSRTWSLSEFLSPQQRARRWLIPSLIAVFVIVTGWIAFQRVEAEFRNTLDSKLTTILATTIHSLSVWSDQQTQLARLVATEPDVLASVSALIEQSSATESGKGRPSDAVARVLHSKLMRIVDNFGFANYRVFDGSGRIVAADDAGVLGKTVSRTWLEQIPQLFCGETVLVEPNREHSDSDTNTGVVPNRGSLIYVASPVIGPDGIVIATIGFGIRPEAEFTRIFSAARAGVSGETYAFNGQGWMLSESRFHDQLKSTGLLPHSPSATSVLNIRVVEDQEFNTAASQSELVLDLDGKKDYRNVRVVSAGQWLPDHGFGVVTKIDHEEAYASHLLLRNIVATLVGIAFVGAIGNLIYTRRLVRAQVRALRAEREVKQLGQYTLQQKLGEGGMGEVYRASHARLRRPTAVKLLRPERSGVAAIERFEREVQTTALLSHPNTVAIYDFGRTSDHVFYYAMEYLDGPDLKKVVEHDGPQPESRVVHLLQQMCGSLKEAHDLGLIHRDIKPANVILCQRGGVHDVAKVLDFGLVYDLTARTDLDTASGISGTPVFMSPESINDPASVDVRSDIYAVGALGYFLLTGKNTFEGSSVADILQRQLTEAPLPPEALSNTKVNEALSKLIMQCLATLPEDRPTSIAVLAQELEKCDVATWTQRAAAKWWHDYRSVVNSTSETSQQDDRLEETIDLRHL